jgi:poly(A) polymerase
MNFPFFVHRENKPVIRQRADHCVSRANIDPDAIKVLYRLSNAGYTAYLVGGGVRDLLLGRVPKDFDVGTDAKPNEIRRIFRNCFLIGRRFRLAQIIFGRKVIETSTFRRTPDKVPAENGLYQMDDNCFGTPEQDAQRRDFTVNGLFYDIKTFAIIDYVGGLKDLEKKLLRCIGDPNVRFQEDPVRMMRAVKFSSRLDFEIERGTLKAIQKHHAQILKASVPRVCEEVYRLFPYRSSRKAFQLMWQLRLLSDLLPELSAYIEASGGDKSPLWRYLDALDADPQSDDATNAVRTACLFYAMYAKAVDDEQRRVGANGRVNRTLIAHATLRSVSQHLRIPRVTLFTSVYLLDSVKRFQFDTPDSGRGKRFLFHPDFPDALQFQRIRMKAEGKDTSKLDAWQKAYEDCADERAPRKEVSANGYPVGPRMTVDDQGAPVPQGDDDSRRRHRRGRGRRAPSPETPKAQEPSGPSTAE